jgi:membrane associated rhomboid family serine protease
VIGRAFDLLFVYFFVTHFEQAHGARRALTLAALSVPAGALVMLIADLAFPAVAIPYGGANAIAYAGLGAFAVLTRGQPMNWLFLPQMNAWGLASILLVINAMQCFWMGTPTPLLASLGGFGAGVAYARWLEKPRAKKPSPKKRTGGSHLHVIPGGQSDDERPRWLN